MREPDRIIRLKTVLLRTGLSRSTIYRKITEGTFPVQLKVSTNSAGWHESAINRWVADPMAWRPEEKSMVVGEPLCTPFQVFRSQTNFRHLVRFNWSMQSAHACINSIRSGQ